MDDVDAVQAQIARNMLQSGDWVTARLDGVAYLEKSPLKYWMMRGLVHDLRRRTTGRRGSRWRLATVLLCWVTARFAAWAFGRRAGLYAGLALATCVGLFLFTRILIPDVMLTLTITLALWAFLRALDEDGAASGRVGDALWAAIAVGLLLKGLIAAVFPMAAAVFLYLAFTRQLFDGRPGGGCGRSRDRCSCWRSRRRGTCWRRSAIRRISISRCTASAAQYHGFFWFYFINEHVLRFLNLRYPRDYNTVPRLYFWLFHLLWLFPVERVFPGGCAKLSLSARRTEPARTRLLALCWIGFVLVFFTFSTTQEYYSMPCYPALALLLGCAMAAEERECGWIAPRDARAVRRLAGWRRSW